MSTSLVNSTQSEFEFSALNEARNYRAALIEAFRVSLRGNVLEVGAGVGQFSQALRALPAIQRHVAVEPDARFMAALTQHVPPSQIVTGTARDVSPAQDWDALVSINVLEHIEDDGGELKLYCELLRSRKGRLCLFVPARAEIFAPIDHDFGHFRRYSKPGLKRLLEEAGFNRIEIRYYNFIGYFAWWFNFCVLRQRQFNPASVRTYDRWIFPLTAWAERFVKPPFGQNLIVIAHSA